MRRGVGPVRIELSFLQLEMAAYLLPVCDCLAAAGMWPLSRRYLMRSSVTRRHVRSHCRLVICVFASQSFMHWANRDCSSANHVSELAPPAACQIGRRPHSPPGSTAEARHRLLDA